MTKSGYFLLLILMFFAAEHPSAGVIHVPGDYTTIYQALDHAYTGDTVLVAPGTYHEQELFMDRGGVVLLGSGAGETILDTQDDDRSVIFVSYNVSDTTAKISGFTITRGNAISSGYGGGIYCAGSPIIENNIIIDNHALRGGGIYVTAGAPTIRDNVISYNTASDMGGGFCGGGCTILRNVIHHNSASNRGGGLCQLAWPLMKCSSNTIVSNYSPQGSALWSYGEPVSLENNIIAYQTGGVAVWKYTECLYGSCNDYWNNAGGDVGRYVLPQCGDPTGINGNIKADPMFCDAGNNDYHIYFDSPCLNDDTCGRIGALGIGCDTVIAFNFAHNGQPVRNVGALVLYGNGIDEDGNNIDDGVEEASALSDQDGNVYLRIPQGRDLTLMASSNDYLLSVKSFLNIEGNESQQISLTPKGGVLDFISTTDVITPLQLNTRRAPDYHATVAIFDRPPLQTGGDNQIQDLTTRATQIMDNRNSEYFVMGMLVDENEETQKAVISNHNAESGKRLMAGLNVLLTVAMWAIKSWMPPGVTIPINPITFSEEPIDECDADLYNRHTWIFGPVYDVAAPEFYGRVCFSSNSSADLLAVDSSGRKTGSVYENGIFQSDEYQIPCAKYSGHAAHPSLLIVPDSIRLDHIVIYPRTTGDYTIKIASVFDSALGFYETKGTWDSLEPQFVGHGIFPDPSNTPVAMINFDTLSIDSGSTVHLDGSASFDPDGGQVFFTWSENKQVFSNSPFLDIMLDPGVHVIGLKVSDEEGFYSFDFASVLVSGTPKESGMLVIEIRDSLSSRFLPDVTTILTGSVSDTLLTDAKGVVCIPLNVGSYELNVNLMNYQSYTDSITVQKEGVTSIGVNLFPNLGKVSGRAFNESTLVGLEGAVIKYLGPDNGMVMSSIDGLYEIIDLPPGFYTLTATFQGIVSKDTANLNVQAGTYIENVNFTFPSFLHGDVNGDGIIALGDVVYLITYLYKNGPAPVPLSAGDVNCNGIVDLGDVVYLITYLYKGGPPPPC